MIYSVSHENVALGLQTTLIYKQRTLSIIQINVPDENAPFKYDLQRQHIVFSGTEILQGKAQSGDYCKAVVIRTGNFRENVNVQGYKYVFIYVFFVGFMTTKGELVRSILFPPPLDFEFHRDFLKSIYVFLTLGLIGMSYSLTIWIRNGVSLVKIQIRET